MTTHIKAPIQQLIAICHAQSRPVVLCAREVPYDETGAPEPHLQSRARCGLALHRRVQTAAPDHGQPVAGCAYRASQEVLDDQAHHVARF